MSPSLQNCAEVVINGCRLAVVVVWWPLLVRLLPLNGGQAENQLRPKGNNNNSKLTSDAISLSRLCCRASVSHSGKGTLDVASRAPRDAGRSCRCHPFGVSWRSCHLMVVASLGFWEGQEGQIVTLKSRTFVAVVVPENSCAKLLRSAPLYTFLNNKLV